MLPVEGNHSLDQPGHLLIESISRQQVYCIAQGFHHRQTKLQRGVWEEGVSDIIKYSFPYARFYQQILSLLTLGSLDINQILNKCSYAENISPSNCMAEIPDSVALFSSAR